MPRFPSITICVALTFFAAGCANKNPPVNLFLGKWESLWKKGGGTLSINFNDNNTFKTVVSRSGQVQLIDGWYKINKDSFFICDTKNSPTQVCNYTDTGCYTFTERNDTLSFKTIIDRCEKRKLTFEIGFDKK